MMKRKFVLAFFSMCKLGVIRKRKDIKMGLVGKQQGDKTT